jgi:signal-transduction protein with cAMP-binding, CBS, and nucleotidyltransferase domain
MQFVSMVIYAQDIMKKVNVTVQGDLTVRQGAKLMANDREGFLIVHKGDGKSSIVTEWDIVYKVVAQDRDPDSVKLEEIASQDIISVDPKTPTEKVVAKMNGSNIRRMAVVEGGKIVGIVTSKDILRIFNDYMDNITEVVSKFGKA